ncbi:MAG: hypothetical protein GC159_00330 [Phycisphaera sp.]|nr:hypothetical protein [Phycisphaera sp.]
MSDKQDNTTPVCDELELLVVDAVERRLDDASHARLEQLLLNNPDNQRRYVALMRVHAMLEWHHGSVVGLREAKLTDDSAKTKDAPLACGVDQASGVAGRVGRFGTAWRVAAMIALVALIGIGAWFARDTGSGAGQQVAAIDRPVVTVTDASNAEWFTDSLEQLEIGQEIAVHDRVRLAGGRMQMMFNSGAVVDVYGPAEFEVLGDNAGRLVSGKLSAWVPARAAGFAVDAPGVTVTDLGTEFGVVAEGGFATQVHVFRGNVRASVKALGNRAARDYPLAADQGLAIPIGDPTSTDKPDTDYAVRVLPTDMELFPRVQPISRIVDLADIVGGGDGSGTGTVRGIRLNDGQPAIQHAEGIQGLPPNRFVPVADNPYVDGVFIPDGGADGMTGVPVTSTGQTVIGLPDTGGGSWDHIWNRPNLRVTDTVLDGVDYSAEGRSLLGFHANKGITFDLAAIRAEYPEWNIQRFTAIAGNNHGSVDYLVLIDGRVAYRLLRHLGSPRGIDVDVPLTDDDRFLTLVACDGGDNLGYDWSIWAQPVLQLRAIGAKR